MNTAEYHHEQHLRHELARYREQHHADLGMIARLRAKVELQENTRLGPVRHCRWCGEPCYGPACPAHTDLLGVDPSLATAGL
jgi:hypothetical protein